MVIFHRDLLVYQRLEWEYHHDGIWNMNGEYKTDQLTYLYIYPVRPSGTSGVGSTLGELMELGYSWI